MAQRFTLLAVLLIQLMVELHDYLVLPDQFLDKPLVFSPKHTLKLDFSFEIKLHFVQQVHQSPLNLELLVQLIFLPHSAGPHPLREGSCIKSIGDIANP